MCKVKHTIQILPTVSSLCFGIYIATWILGDLHLSRLDLYFYFTQYCFLLGKIAEMQLTLTLKMVMCKLCVCV